VVSLTLRALYSGVKAPVHIREKDGWASELVWKLWGDGKSLTLSRNQTPVIQPVPIPTKLFGVEI
jgi:hypothetical protein